MREAVTVAQDDEARVAQTFPLPFELGAVRPKKLKDLFQKQVQHEDIIFEDEYVLTSPICSLEAGPISYPLRAAPGRVSVLSTECPSTIIVYQNIHTQRMQRRRRRPFARHVVSIARVTTRQSTREFVFPHSLHVQNSQEAGGRGKKRKTQATARRASVSLHPS